MSEKRRSEYLEKLRDPRWQRKRLEVMQRDEFMCQACFDATSTLNVHHNWYESGADPWDYPLDALVTLCEECHESETENRHAEEMTLLRVLRRAGFKAAHINGLACSLYEAFHDAPMFPDHWDYYLSKYIRNFHDVAADVADFLHEQQKATKAKTSEEIEKA